MGIFNDYSKGLPPRTIKQFDNNDRSWEATQARNETTRILTANQKARDDAAAANPTGKPKLDLLQVPKNTAFNKYFDDTLSNLDTDRGAARKDLEDLTKTRLDLRPKMQSLVDEDVANLGANVSDYTAKTQAGASKYQEDILKGRDLVIDQATGGLERARMSKNPYLGYGTSNTYDAAQALAPIYNQAAQRGNEVNQTALDRILSANQSLPGRRQGILTSADAFNRGMLDDRQRLAAGDLANAGSYANTFGNMNFLGVGGQVPDSLPYSLQSNFGGTTRSAYRPPVNHFALNAVRGGGIGGGIGGGKGGGGTGGVKDSAPTRGPADAQEAYYSKYGSYPQYDPGYTPQRWEDVGGTTQHPDGSRTRGRSRSAAEESYKDAFGSYPNEDSNFSTDPSLRSAFRRFGGVIQGESVPDENY